MGRLIVYFLSFFLSFYISLECYAAERVKQETKGDQSPAIYNNPGAISHTTYNIYNAAIDQAQAEINKERSKWLEFISDFQSKKLEDLNKTIALLLVRNEGIPDEDAKKWATDIIEKAPVLKKEIETNKTLINKQNEELSKDLVAKVYKAFVYIFETADSKFLALKELSPKAKYEKDEKFILFSDETNQIKSYAIRSFVLANGNRINITLVPGNLRQGIIQACPSLYFSELTGHKSFRVSPHYGGGTITFGGKSVELKKEKTLSDMTYSATGADILTDQFKEQFNKIFTEFIQLAFIQ